jgi:hypothetical protein
MLVYLPVRPADLARRGEQQEEAMQAADATP